MEDEKVDDAPIRFYAIAQSSYEGYWEEFVFATSAEDALKRWIKWINSNDPVTPNPFSHKFKVDVLEAHLNEFGCLVSKNTVISDREVEC